MYDYDLKEIEPYSFFNDNSSKVWLIDKVYQSNFDLSPKNIEEKEIIVFHKSKRYYTYSQKNFSKGSIYKGDFYFDKNKVIFTYKSKIDTFIVKYYSHDKIILIDEINNLKKVLISFPEF